MSNRSIIDFEQSVEGEEKKESERSKIVKWHLVLIKVRSVQKNACNNWELVMWNVRGNLLSFVLH